MMLFPALNPMFKFLSSKFPDPAAAKRLEALRRLNGFILDLIRRERAAIAQGSRADLGDSNCFCSTSTCGLCFQYCKAEHYLDEDALPVWHSS